MCGMMYFKKEVSREGLKEKVKENLLVHSRFRSRVIVEADKRFGEDVHFEEIPLDEMDLDDYVVDMKPFDGAKRSQQCKSLLGYNPPSLIAVGVPA